jgi:hypothetical protein
VVRSPDRGYIEARNPQLSVLWLADVDHATASPKLLAQPVAFRRSQQLNKDWEIGMAEPLESAKIRRNVGASNPPLAIGQMVYFDDGNGDGEFTWSCKGRSCDEIKAISSEFVVYLDQPVICASKSLLGVEAMPLAAGFHHFTWDGTSIEERPLNRDLQFILHESPPPSGQYMADLKNFAQQLTRAYQLNALGGC